MKLARVLLLLLVPSIVYAGNTCEVKSAEFYDDIQISSDYGVYMPVIKSCAAVEVMNTSGGDRLTVYITAHFLDGNNQKQGFSGSYVERGRTRAHKMCWSKDYQIKTFTCEF